MSVIRVTDQSTQPEIAAGLELGQRGGEKQVEIDALLERWPSAAPA